MQFSNALDTKSALSDSSRKFFDEMELLRWSGQYRKAAGELTKLLDTDSASDLVRMKAKMELAENLRLQIDASKALAMLNSVEMSHGQNTSLDGVNLVRLLLYKAKAFRSLNLIDSAEYYYQKALDNAKKKGVEDSAEVGEVWMDWAFLQTNRMGKLDVALEYNINAQKNYQNSLPPSHIKNASVFYELASNYRNLDDFERAENCARLAELIYKINGESFRHLQLNSRAVQANCLFNNGDFKGASSIYKEVLFDYANDVVARESDLIRITFSSGETLLYLDEIDQAKMSMEKAIGMNKRENETDSLNLAYSYSTLSHAETQLGNYDVAESLLITSSEIIKHYYEEPNAEIAEVYCTLGKNRELQGDYNTALNYYQKALVSSVAGFNEMEIEYNPTDLTDLSIEISLDMLLGKARNLMHRYQMHFNDVDRSTAFDLYVQVNDLMRATSNENMMEESLLEIPQIFERDLELGIKCVMGLYKQTGETFYFNKLMHLLETNKYFLLQNSVKKSRMKEVLGIPDSIYQKEKELLVHMNELKQELGNATFTNEKEELDRRFELFRVTQQWDKLRNQWNQSARSVVSQNRPEDLSLEDIRDSILDDQDILLEYFQADDSVYTLVITKNRQEVIQKHKSIEFENALNEYLNQLIGASSEDPTSNMNKFIWSSNYLYEQLIEPALHTPKVDPSINRLIIIPDGQLALVPFESLIQKTPKDTNKVNYFGLNYLCLDYTINYGYSLNILRDNLAARSSKPAKSVLGLSYSSIDQGSTAALRDGKFGELPYSAIELRAIQKTFSDGLYLDGSNATEYHFKSEVGEADIVHLALHGEADTADILNSRIVFKEAGDPNEDGFLYAHELYGIDLSQTQMAVLSACETGRGRSMEGEGVYSLARGFAYAGCPSIVMSLWEVNDKTTARIMDYFYQFVAKGLPKDEALRRAKLQYLSNSNDYSAHPANWAAFISLGNAKPIDFPNQRDHYYYAILFFTLLVLVIAYRMRKRIFKIS